MIKALESHAEATTIGLIVVANSQKPSYLILKVANPRTTGWSGGHVP
jgi:hypothetical protein